MKTPEYKGFGRMQNRYVGELALEIGEQKNLVVYLQKRLQDAESDPANFSEKKKVLMKNLLTLSRAYLHQQQKLSPKEKYVHIKESDEAYLEEGEFWKKNLEPEKDPEEVMIQPRSPKDVASFEKIQDTMANLDHTIATMKKQLEQEFPGEHWLLEDYMRNIARNVTN